MQGISAEPIKMNEKLLEKEYRIINIFKKEQEEMYVGIAISEKEKKCW